MFIVDDTAGRYRIQVVAELTGVPAATLRAWERRYGIPQPSRTESAYRLYSGRDVEMVRQLRDLCANGMAISQAARVVRDASGGPSSEAPVAEDVYLVAVERILDAVRGWDEARVTEEVARALYIGPAATVYERVFSPVLRTIGDLWHEGAISVAQEHLASRAIGPALRSVARMVQPSGDLPLVVLACFAEETHDLGMHGVVIRLASWGIRAVDLGARVPPEALGDAVRRLAPQGVGLSITVAGDPSRARELVDAYAEQLGELPWFVGGAAVSSVAARVLQRGGIVVEGELSGARSVIEAALRGEYRPVVKPKAR